MRGEHDRPRARAFEHANHIGRRLPRRPLHEGCRCPNRQGYSFESTLHGGGTQLVEVFASASNQILRGVVRHPRFDAERRRSGNRRQRILRSGPRGLHHLPGISGRLVGVNQQRACRSLTRRFLELVGPAAIVGERLAAEQIRFVRRRGRIVHHDQHPLALDVSALVVIPLLFRRHDAVADKDDVALHLHLRAFQPGKRDHVGVIAIRPARHAQRKVAIDDGFDNRDLLEVRAVLTSRLDAHRHQLIGQKLRGKAAAARRRGAALEQIARKHLDVRLDGRFLNLIQRRTRRWRRCRGSRGLPARNRHRDEDDEERRSAHVPRISRARSRHQNAGPRCSVRPYQLLQIANFPACYGIPRTGAQRCR